MDILSHFFSSAVDIISVYLQDNCSLQCPIRFHELLRRLYFHAVDKALYCRPRVRPAMREDFPFLVSGEFRGSDADLDFFISTSYCTAHSMTGEPCLRMAHSPFALCRAHLNIYHSVFDLSREVL